MFSIIGLYLLMLYILYCYIGLLQYRKAELSFYAPPRKIWDFLRQSQMFFSGTVERRFHLGDFLARD